MKPLLGKTVVQVFNSIAAKYHGNDTLIFVEQNFLYIWAEFLDATNAVAKGLMMLGV